MLSGLYQDMQAKAVITQKVLPDRAEHPDASPTGWVSSAATSSMKSNGSEGTATELACIDNGALAAFLTQWKAMYDAGALINESGSADMFIAGDRRNDDQLFFQRGPGPRKGQRRL